MRNRFFPLDDRAPYPRIAARDQTLHGRTVAADRLARPSDRRGVGQRRRAPDDGWRTDVCVHRRHGRRGMEHDRARPEETRVSRHVDQTVATTVRPGRLVAVWAGQMVSGRIVAALGVELLLAARRRANLE